MKESDLSDFSSQLNPILLQVSNPNVIMLANNIWGKKI